MNLFVCLFVFWICRKSEENKNDQETETNYDKIISVNASALFDK